MNNLLLKALKNENNTSQVPVWLMRQAGRYMPKYRAIRAKHSFLDMCHTPEIAAEVTMLPIKEFGMDGAILFSDILVVAEALQVGLRFEEGVGPIIERPLNNKNDVEALPEINAKESLGYVAKAIKLLKQQLKVPLLGFCGAPFTVASYMIEGKSSRDFRKTKEWMLSDPDSFHLLLKKIAACTIDYLKMQAEAGVDAIQIFDSWAHTLAFNQFEEFSLAYQKELLDGVRKAFSVPVILFCRGSSVFAESLATINPSAISLDWNGNMGEIRKKIPRTIALQGNLDPDILCAPKAMLTRETNRMLKQMENDPGYIFNLGHGILPHTPMEAVHTLIEKIRG